MKTLAISYIAGFFDGEGCISIGKSKDIRLPKGYTDRIRVKVSQVDRRPLDAIRAQFGGNIALCNTGVHELVMGDMPSIHVFLTSMLPHLIVKKDIAERAILFCESRMAAAKRFGDRNEELRELRDSDPKTWTQLRLAERFGMSRRRVRQIIERREGHGEPKGAVPRP